MANSYFYGVLEDAQHNLWISTNGGLSYFDRNKNSFRNYYANDGLQSNEFNTGAFYKGASGTLYFGGIKGFNWFQNISINSNYKPQVALTDIYVNDKKVPKDSSFIQTKTLHFPFKQNNISFQFAALDYSRPGANKIQYKLEGADENWTTTYNKSVRYPQLPPGDYVLRLKAANADGLWSEEEKFFIVIEAPFWKRWWFFAILLVIATISVILITREIAQRRFRKQLQELEKQRAVELERNRLSKDMHDEIGSGLTHIALLSELMQTQNQTEEELKKNVGAISFFARKLVESMSEIIWVLNPQNDTLENLLAYTREQMHAFFEPFTIDFTIDFPSDVPTITLSNEQRRNLFLVTKEALNNALKHSEADAITLRVIISDNQIAFAVTDNGKDFNPSQTKAVSNGLKNMKKRIDDIGGTFFIDNNERGTTIHFTITIHTTTNGATTFLTSKQKN
ncbi:MAG: hypothetical protein C4330_05505 [Chitinophagaceae bacterium]